MEQVIGEAEKVQDFRNEFDELKSLLETYFKSFEKCYGDGGHDPDDSDPDCDEGDGFIPKTPKEILQDSMRDNIRDSKHASCWYFSFLLAFSIILLFYGVFSMLGAIQFIGNEEM